jgi:hypothetical protein
MPYSFETIEGKPLNIGTTKEGGTATNEARKE